jgi:hypothetical protein
LIQTQFTINVHLFHLALLFPQDLPSLFLPLEDTSVEDTRHGQRQLTTDVSVRMFQTTLALALPVTLLLAFLSSQLPPLARSLVGVAASHSVEIWLGKFFPGLSPSLCFVATSGWPNRDRLTAVIPLQVVWPHDMTRFLQLTPDRVQTSCARSPYDCWSRVQRTQLILSIRLHKLRVLAKKSLFLIVVFLFFCLSLFLCPRNCPRRGQ